MPMVGMHYLAIWPYNIHMGSSQGFFLTRQCTRVIQHVWIKLVKTSTKMILFESKTMMWRHYLSFFNLSQRMLQGDESQQFFWKLLKPTQNSIFTLTSSTYVFGLIPCNMTMKHCIVALWSHVCARQLLLINLASTTVFINFIYSLNWETNLITKYVINNNIMF